MKIINQISIDFANTQALPRYLTVQGDAGRKIEFTLYSGGSKLEMTTGTVCLVKYRCSDGTGGCYDTLPDGTTAYSISGNTVTVTLAPQVLAKAGNVNLQITLIDGDSVLTTFAIVLHNHADIAVGTIPSEDYVNVENLTARALSAALRAEEFAKSITTCMVVSYESGSLNTATGAEASLSTRIRSGYFPNLSGTIGVTAPATVKSRLVFYNGDLSFHSSAVGFTAGSYQVSKDAAFARLIVGYADDSDVADVDALANMVAVYMPVEVPETTQALTVTITGNNADGYTADNDVYDIISADGKGQECVCHWGAVNLPLVRLENEVAYFAAVVDGIEYRVEIGSDSVVAVCEKLGRGAFDVMIMGSEADGYTASKTLTEILTAHNNQTVRCLYNGQYLALVYIDGSMAGFSTVSDGIEYRVEIWTDRVFVSSNELGGNVFDVTVTGNDTDGYVADKTYEEIRAAEAEGLVLRCWYGTKVLSLVYSSEIYLTFGCVVNDVSYRVVIDETKVKIYENKLVPASRTINGKALSADVTLTGADIPTAQDDAVPLKNRINTIQDYMYTTEKLCRFVTSADAILEIDTDTNKVKVNSGFLFYRNDRMDTTETTVDIDQTSVFSMVVRDNTTKTIRSIAPTAFDGETMFVIAILRRDYYTIPTANYVIGTYRVNGFLYNTPVSQPVYVSATGSDANVGDRQHPFKTIGKAVNSGAKTIFVFAGTYQEAVSASRTGDELEIIAKPNSYADKTVVIDLGHSLTMEDDSATGLVKAAYASTADDFIHKVFVDNTEALTAEDSNGYVCNLWSGDTRLVPVLTLEECLATAGTWFYDGTNVYANGAAGTYTLSDGASEYGIHLSYFKRVKLTGIVVRNARKDAIRLDACSYAEIDRCAFCYSGLYHGLALESTSAVVRNCTAKHNGKDGLNIHGVCTADFIGCISHHNGDDGISHHDQSGGVVIGGEYYNNVKGGVCSPTFGSRNGISGVRIHDNGNGVYAVTAEDGVYPSCNVSDCVITGNGVGIRANRYTLNCWNVVLSDNGKDVQEDNGGSVNIIGGSTYTLPVATSERLGGVMPVAKTDEMTVPVGVDAAGGLWVNASGGTQDGSGSSGGATETMLVDFTLEEDVSQVDIPLDDAAIAALNSAREIFFELGLTMPAADDGTETGTLTFGIAANWGMNLTLMQAVKCLPTNAAAWADGCNAVGVVTLSKISRICTGMYTFRVNNTTAVSTMVGGTYSNIAGGQTLRAVGSIPIGAGSRIRLYVR